MVLCINSFAAKPIESLYNSLESVNPDLVSGDKQAAVIANLNSKGQAEQTIISINYDKKLSQFKLFLRKNSSAIKGLSKQPIIDLLVLTSGKHYISFSGKTKMIGQKGESIIFSFSPKKIAIYSPK